MKRLSLLIAAAACLCVAFAPADATAQSKKSKTAVKAKPKTSPSKAKEKPHLKPIAGTWFMRDAEDKEVRSTRIVFDKFGGFKWIGSYFNSAGTYDLKEGHLLLTWTHIDGEKVKPGTVKKNLELVEELSKFKIDRFTYGKQLPAKKS